MVTGNNFLIEPSISRRLPQSNRNNPVKLLKINKKMILNARPEGHD